MSEFINRAKGQRVRSSVTQQTWGLLSLDRRHESPGPPFFSFSLRLCPSRFGGKWGEEAVRSLGCWLPWQGRCCGSDCGGKRQREGAQTWLQHMLLLAPLHVLHLPVRFIVVTELVIYDLDFVCESIYAFEY